jgi:hypothetical protein
MRRSLYNLHKLSRGEIFFYFYDFCGNKVFRRCGRNKNNKVFVSSNAPPAIITEALDLKFDQVAY